MSQTIRYTLLLDPKANSNVEDLQRRYGLRSKAAVFDLAATLLLWVSEQQAKGFQVGRSDGTSFAEVLLPTPLKQPVEAGVVVTAKPGRTAAKRKPHLTPVKKQEATS